MSNFESNELRPDSSDRPNRRPAHHDEPSRFANPFAKLNLSRQHLMIAIGVIILLIIILTIVSSLTNDNQENIPVEQHNIQLPSNQPVTNNTNNVLPPVDNSNTQVTEPREITIAPDNTTTPPTTNNQANTGSQTNVANPSSQSQSGETTTATNNTPPANQTKAPQTSPTQSANGLPTGKVTLQLSGASQKQSLEAFAKKHNLANYWIYETRRDGKPWFVLIYGSYANAQEATKAIATLPADIRANKPWVKPTSQVQREAKLR